MLEAINLSKHYNGAIALDSLDLEIEPGEVFCLLGANGAGKTTTINLFLNFIEPTSGTAMIKGLDVTKEPLETKRYIAYIPEQVTLYKNLSGWRTWSTSRRSPGTRDIRAISCSSFLKRSVCSAKSRTIAFQRTRKA
jgi:ABC-2 type transport system ATP-binding protein